MSTLMQASREWAARPDDQRFTSLDELVEFTRHQREISKGVTLDTRKLLAAPIDKDEDPERKGLLILANDVPTVPTNFSFGQLAGLVKAPAGYLRTLPAEIAADALNYGIFSRDVDEVGTLQRDNGNGVLELAAATGPNYGRVWNSDVATAIRGRFGDGITGDFTVPGEFGKAIDVTKRNTTIYASDRDMFVFLADEKHKIEMPNRRNGKPGLLSRGVFFWNSEVGSTTLGMATFLFDYTCSNRMVWGAENFQEIKVRHSVGAPQRWIEQVAPAIEAYANKSADSVTEAIEKARSARIAPDNLDEFLSKRFTKGQVSGIKLAHLAAEDRPIENIWDATVGITQFAQSIKHQDNRVDLERKAGQLMKLAA